MDPVQLAEDVAAHVRVPAARLVAEVDSGLQQLFEACLWHVEISLVCGESPPPLPGTRPGRPVRIRVGCDGGRFEPADCSAEAALRRPRAASSAAARSAGSSEAKLSALAARRVGEGEPVGVQELALEAVALLAAVGRVAGQRVADRGEVGADLVGAAGLQARLEVGLGGEQLEHLEVGAGLPRGGAGDRHPVALPRGAADRRVDRPGARGEPPAGQRQVDALDLAPPHLLLQGGVGLVVAGDDQQAAGLLVEPVDDPGALGVGAAAEDLAQLVDQGRPAVRGRRVDDEPGRLVDHRQRARRGGRRAARSVSLRLTRSSQARAGSQASSTTPTVIATSARLNGGQERRST